MGIRREPSTALTDAAPDLLKALEGLIKYVPGGCDADTEGRPWLWFAFQVIAKAKAT